MKTLSKLRLTSKVEILNDNEMKHLRGGYTGTCIFGDRYTVCLNHDIGGACCWDDAGGTHSGTCSPNSWGGTTTVGNYRLDV